MSWTVACRVTYRLGEKHFVNTSDVPPKHNASDDLPVPQVTGKKVNLLMKVLNIVLLFHRYYM